jgi:hypothetical protein
MSEQQQNTIDLSDAVTIPQAEREWPEQVKGRIRYASLRFPEIILRRPQNGWPLLLSRRLLADRLLTLRSYRTRDRPPPRPRTAAGEVGNGTE